jgi:hypothetical protein
VKRWSSILAGCSAIVSLRIAYVPISILLGKLPHPSVGLLLHVILAQALVVLAPGAVLIVAALRPVGRRTDWQRAALLAAAPLACLGTLFLVLW